MPERKVQILMLFNHTLLKPLNYTLVVIALYVIREPPTWFRCVFASQMYLENVHFGVMRGCPVNTCTGRKQSFLS